LYRTAEDVLTLCFIYFLSVINLALNKRKEMEGSYREYEDNNRPASPARPGGAHRKPTEEKERRMVRTHPPTATEEHKEPPRFRFVTLNPIPSTAAVHRLGSHVRDRGTQLTITCPSCTGSSSRENDTFFLPAYPSSFAIGKKCSCSLF
jgi:hypothetical protein